MPVKRQSLRRGRGRRLKRVKRTLNISRPRWAPSLRAAVPQISIKRTCYLGSMTPNTVATYGFWQYRTVSLTNGFYDQTLSSMGGLSNYSEYQSIFDQYRLGAFKIVLRPRIIDMNQDQSAATLGRDMCYVTVVKDPTDNVSPTGTFTAATLNTFLECGKARTFRGDKPVTIYMKPQVQEQYGGGSNRYVKPQWTDLTATGVTMPHRGFHLFFHNQQMTSNVFNSYDVFITYYLKFRGMK